jgi:hypothetical protein
MPKRGLLNISGLALALCGLCAITPAHADFVKRPPARYRDNQPGVHIVQVPTGEIAALCGQIASRGEKTDRTVVGCEKDGVVFLPNACEWQDPYAQLVCHETAHAGGWPADHPEY